MQKNRHIQAFALLKGFLRIVLWLGIGVIGVGIVIIVPLAVIIVAIGVLSKATPSEASLMMIGIIIFTCGFWSLVWWFDKSGIARWHENEIETIEADFEASDGEIESDSWRRS